MHESHLCSSSSSFGSSHMGPKEAMAAGTSSHHTLPPKALKGGYLAGRVSAAIFLHSALYPTIARFSLADVPRVTPHRGMKNRVLYLTGISHNPQPDSFPVTGEGPASQSQIHIFWRPDMLETESAQDIGSPRREGSHPPRQCELLARP